MRYCALFVAAGLILAVAGTAGATTVDWSTGSAYMENLGNTCHSDYSTFPAGSNIWGQTDTECDKVTLGTSSGSLELTLGVPQTVVVNPLTFEIGWTGDMGVGDTKSNVYYLTRNITVNGITKSLVNPMTHNVTYFTDYLQVGAGAPVAFGDIIVTPLGWVQPLGGGNYAVLGSSVSAQFLEVEAPPVPEPLTMAGLGLGIAGLVGYLRRRRG